MRSFFFGGMLAALFLGMLAPTGSAQTPPGAVPFELQLAPAGHDNRSAFECQTVCGRETDAGGAARNESNLAFVFRGVKLLPAHGRFTIAATIA